MILKSFYLDKNTYIYVKINSKQHLVYEITHENQNLWGYRCFFKKQDHFENQSESELDDSLSYMLDNPPITN